MQLKSILDNMGGNFTGILIDIRDVNNFKKALMVKLVNEKGKEFYPSGKVSKSTLTKRNTSVGYIFGLNDARKNKRVFSTPLEIKAQSTYKNKLSNIVISDSQINMINSLDEAVLKSAKIILVLGD